MLAVLAVFAVFAVLAVHKPSQLVKCFGSESDKSATYLLVSFNQMLESVESTE